jgi:DNA mismatch repair protein MutH
VVTTGDQMQNTLLSHLHLEKQGGPLFTTGKGLFIKEIQEDYELIRQKLITQGFESLTGKDGKWIQTRTKGAGHGSTSRAFYARKELVKVIFGI